MMLCPKCKVALRKLPPVCKDDPESTTPCKCDDAFECLVCKKTWYWGCVDHHYGNDELPDPDETWH